MDFLSSSPQDQINMIYEYLPINDLINIGSTNRKFYNDANRRKLLVNKLVDDYLYISIYDQPILTSEYFCPQRYYKDLVEVYFDRLKKISFHDLVFTQSNNECFISIQNILSVRHFKFNSSLNEYGIVIPFSFFVDAFIQLETSVKKDIISRVFQYLLNLWKHAEKSVKCIYNTKTLHRQTENVASDSFEFSQLFLSLNQILTEIFTHETNEQIRQYIVDQFSSVQKTTQESKYYYIVVNDEYIGHRTLFDQETVEGEECSYYSNDYDILHFIRTLDVSPVNIPKVVELGLFFLKQKCNHLRAYHIETFILATFIAEVFDDFMGGEDETLDFIDKGPDSILDSYSEFINDQLLMEYKPGTKFDDVLENLFHAANFNYRRFKKVLHFRLNRWNGK
jgi:hypothetical protein